MQRLMAVALTALTLWAAGSTLAAVGAKAPTPEQQFVSGLAAARAVALQAQTTTAVWRTVNAPRRYFYGVSYRDPKGKTVTLRSAYESCQSSKQLLDDALYAISARRVNTRCFNYGNLAEFSGTIEALVETTP